MIGIKQKKKVFIIFFLLVKYYLGAIIICKGFEEDYDKSQEIIQNYENELEEYLQKQKKYFEDSKITYVYFNLHKLFLK